MNALSLRFPLPIPFPYPCPCPCPMNAPAFRHAPTEFIGWARRLPPVALFGGSAFVVRASRPQRKRTRTEQCNKWHVRRQRPHSSPPGPRSPRVQSPPAGVPSLTLCRARSSSHRAVHNVKGGIPRSAGGRVRPRSRSEIGTDRSEARVGRRAQSARANPEPERRTTSSHPGQQEGRRRPGSVVSDDPASFLRPRCPGDAGSPRPRVEAAQKAALAGPETSKLLGDLTTFSPRAILLTGRPVYH